MTKTEFYAVCRKGLRYGSAGALAVVEYPCLVRLIKPATIATGMWYANVYTTTARTPGAQIRVAKAFIKFRRWLRDFEASFVLSYCLPTEPSLHAIKPLVWVFSGAIPSPCGFGVWAAVGAMGRTFTVQRELNGVYGQRLWQWITDIGDRPRLPGPSTFLVASAAMVAAEEYYRTWLRESLITPGEDAAESAVPPKLRELDIAGLGS